jgi:flagellar hook-associated protein 1 FlgK
MTVSPLSNALAGLKAAQSSINVVSNNITNASTPGYTRKVLPQQSAVTQLGEGFGVRISEVIRKVDDALIRDLLGQKSNSEAAGIRESYLSRVMDFHGASEKEISLSAELSGLNEGFAELSAAPDDNILLSSVVSQSRVVADKFNDMSQYLTQLRNDTQNELRSIVSDVNSTLEHIATLNNQIAGLTAQNRSAAGLEDQRDEAMRELSKYMEIRSFKADSGRLVVMTNNGATLADNEARQLAFAPIPLGATSSLGNGGSTALTIAGTPPTDLTQLKTGGQIEALLELRDQTLPQYHAQLDELAQKTSMRFAEQGLTLFTDEDGNVPAHVAPPATVGYNGFSEKMQVNADVMQDHSLIRTGTNGETVLDGSNAIIDRVLEFAFGENKYYEATGSVDISAGTVFARTGIQQQAQIVGATNLTNFTPLDSHPDITAGDQFSIDTGGGAVTVTINAADGPTDLVNSINTAVGAGTARLNDLGQLVIEGNADITIADVSLGAAGMAAIGHSAGTTAAENPSFSVQVGQQSPVTISIAPTDTQTDLLADLNAVPGITASLGGSGELIIQPLDSSGISHGRLTLDDGLGLPLKSMGMKTGKVSHTAFRTQNMGVDGNLSTEISGNSKIEGFGKSMIAFQAEQHAQADRAAESSSTFYNTLNERFLNETGVDIDQELTELIKFQTAYTAATQLIQASEKQFNDLMNALR